ncbi:immunity 50 family protein [Kitasatospora sp. NBC_01287]|uniref:Imm50 family immunity protein n=1 Tax=Kitasatospora sp. NBC_01287 TaxID=2903573 RepID=UPI002252F0A8|nr:Imm50 family immunity protein [Kitasatospora sp. NBC_01287]MCX4750556.1 immunity 50 family protein [Kitasatospora sp. NBC_01287]
MTPAWGDFLRNPEKLSGLYENPSSIEPLVLHSVYLDRLGPTITLRLSTTGLPDRMPTEWLAAECDRFEFHLQFLDIADLSMTRARFPASISVDVVARELHRIRVDVLGGSTHLGFSSHRSVTIGRLSAWNSRAPEEQPIHHYLSPLDRRLHSAPPDTWKKNYYGRI